MGLIGCSKVPEQPELTAIKIVTNYVVVTNEILKSYLKQPVIVSNISPKKLPIVIQSVSVTNTFPIINNTNLIFISDWEMLSRSNVIEALKKLKNYSTLMFEGAHPNVRSDIKKCQYTFQFEFQKLRFPRHASFVRVARAAYSVYEFVYHDAHLHNVYGVSYNGDIMFFYGDLTFLQNVGVDMEELSKMSQHKVDASGSFYYKIDQSLAYSIIKKRADYFVEMLSNIR